MNPAIDVLLVDDEESSVDLFRMACESTGSRLRLEVACDGVAALERLHADGAAAPPSPRLLLLDLGLPRLSGFDVLRRLRADERTRGLRVVVFTASDRETDRAHAFRLGADGYEAKPMRFADLCELVKRIESDWIAEPAGETP